MDQNKWLCFADRPTEKDITCFVQALARYRDILYQKAPELLLMLESIKKAYFINKCKRLTRPTETATVIPPPQSKPVVVEHEVLGESDEEEPEPEEPKSKKQKK